MRYPFDGSRVRQRISLVAQHSAGLTLPEADEVAFHMTDWFSDLGDLMKLYEAPEAMNDQEAIRVLSNFLVHVPNHVAAAAALLVDCPVSDIFGVGAVSHDGLT